MWAVGVVGGCGHALAVSKHLGHASQVWVVARPGWDGVWALGVVRARGGCGHALAAFKYFLNT